MDWLSTLIPSDPAQQEWLNVVLHLLHSGMVLFVLLGWIWRPLLTAHRSLLIVIWLSWIGLGWLVGYYGYCILTDYHWQLGRAMGDTDLPPSYIEYLLRIPLRHDLPDRAVSIGTGIVFAVMTFVSFFRRRTTGNPFP